MAQEYKMETIGEYLVGKTLGEGSFGKVRLGIHKTTGAKVALKLVDREKLVKQKDQVNLEREIKIMKLISHPRIVRMFECFDVPNINLTVLVMEYVPGGDLFDLITKETRLGEAKAARLFRQMVEAIDYLHRNLIIHRDLKPENIMIDENEEVKINDFGLSNFMKVNEGELMATFCGSPHYASPEIMKERRYIGPEVDVWSLGVLLYTMCTGLFPWDGDSLAEVMRNAVRARYVVPEFLSNDCKNIIGRMLEPDPSKRATLEEIRVHPWLSDGLRIPQHIAKRKKVTQIDEQIFKKLRDFGLNEEEARKSILGNQFTSQAFVLYTLIEEYLDKEKQKQEAELKKRPTPTPTLTRSENGQPANLRERRGSAGPLTIPLPREVKTAPNSAAQSPAVEKKERSGSNTPKPKQGLFNRLLKRRDSENGSAVSSFFARKRSDSASVLTENQPKQTSVDGLDGTQSPTLQQSPNVKKIMQHNKRNSEDLTNVLPKIENKMVKKIMYE